MKHVKMLGLAVVAAAALTAFAGAASASASEGVICSTTANPCPGGQKWAVPTKLHFTSEETVKTTTTGGFITVETCSTVTILGYLTENPNSTGTATGTNHGIIWGSAPTPCTKLSSTIALGKFKIRRIAGTSNGTVIADAPIKKTVQGLFSGENCVYGVSEGTSIGTLTEGNPATFDLSAVAVKFPEEDPCPSGPATTMWTGKFTLTEPANTTLSVSSS